jgi:hypothetical protein
MKENMCYLSFSINNLGAGEIAQQSASNACLLLLQMLGVCFLALTLGGLQPPVTAATGGSDTLF